MHIQGNSRTGLTRVAKMARRKIANSLFAGLAVSSLLGLTACASHSELQPHSLTKMAATSSCDNPVIVQHPQLTLGYPEDLRAEESRFISGPERIASLFAMGFDVVDYGEAHCEDPRIHKYKYSPSLPNKTREASGKSPQNKSLSYTLYALHMTPWQINADPSVTCKTRYTQYYQPPLKLHGVARVNLIPDGKQCQKTSLSFSDIPKALQIVLSFDGFVDDVDDTSIACSEAIEFEDTPQEFRESFPSEFYTGYPEKYDIVKTLYKLNRLHADVCKIYLNTGSLKLLLAKITNSHDLLDESNCYDRKQVLRDKKLPKACREEAFLVANIYRVYAKSLAQNRRRVDEEDANTVTEIQKVNQSAKARLSVYLSLLAKYDQPVVLLEDEGLNFGPLNSFSMKIRYISADAIYSIDQYLEGD